MTALQSIRRVLLEAFARPPTPQACRSVLDELKAAAASVPDPAPEA